MSFKNLRKIVFLIVPSVYVIRCIYWSTRNMEYQYKNCISTLLFIIIINRITYKSNYTRSPIRLLLYRATLEIYYFIIYCSILDKSIIEIAVERVTKYLTELFKRLSTIISSSFSPFCRISRYKLLASDNTRGEMYQHVSAPAVNQAYSKGIKVIRHFPAVWND